MKFFWLLVCMITTQTLFPVITELETIETNQLIKAPNQLYTFCCDNNFPKTVDFTKINIACVVKECFKINPENCTWFQFTENNDPAALKQQELFEKRCAYIKWYTAPLKVAKKKN